MHDVLRARVMRKIESLPEEQIYQILDYIEFLESRYGAPGDGARSSGFQRIGEEIEDRMRKSAFKPSNLREAFQVIAAADRALSGVAKAGRQLFDEIAGGGTDPEAPSERETDRRPRERREGDPPSEPAAWDRDADSRADDRPPTQPPSPEAGGWTRTESENR